jgi:hypothetical protein
VHYADKWISMQFMPDCKLYTKRKVNVMIVMFITYPRKYANNAISLEEDTHYYFKDFSNG